MEKIKLLVTVWIMVTLFSGVEAQNTLPDAHKKLTETHSKLNKKHDALNSGTVKDYKKHVEEVTALLETAKKQRTDIEKKQLPKDKEAAQTLHDAIKKNHEAATVRLQNMTEEAAKDKPDVNKLKEQSKLMNSQVKEAEKHNQAMSKLKK